MNNIINQYLYLRIIYNNVVIAIYMHGLNKVLHIRHPQPLILKINKTEKGTRTFRTMKIICEHISFNTRNVSLVSIQNIH